MWTDARGAQSKKVKSDFIYIMTSIFIFMRDEHRYIKLYLKKTCINLLEREKKMRE